MRVCVGVGQIIDQCMIITTGRSTMPGFFVSVPNLPPQLLRLYISHVTTSRVRMAWAGR